ncbi:amidohydrolase [Ignatzschineria ureiclastica]|uniref:Amidohydrolase n=2 Tax=Ignatzschineria ureiclastica TaxID=472582 RepID=A0A2U2AEA4_9GAMM|nr:amidohydrolase [Ignatzschineria ureiclastica]
MIMSLLPGMQTIAEEITKIRHYLHQHPELGFEEIETSNLVAEKLTAWGYKVTRGFGKTGMVAQLSTGDGPTIGLRADMDALPITEENNFSHKSQNPGKMHACGHDGHTSTLLAAAQYLAENPHFQGTVNLYIQPAEEGLGGAKAMIDDGALQQFPCDAMFGFHNMPGFPAGHFGFKAGSAMASSDRVTVTITGKGGHGAMPQFSIDPIVIASSIVMSLQTIVSRNVDPLKMTVISVGSIHAGQTFNVIPETATMQLSIRNLDPATQDQVETRVKEIINGQAASFGASAAIDYVRSYPILYNHATETEFAQNVARQVLGDEKIIDDFPAMTASEDFAFFANEVSACYLFVGNGDIGTYSCSVHNPKYDFNDALIPIVANYWVNLVYAFCPKQS